MAHFCRKFEITVIPALLTRYQCQLRRCMQYGTGAVSGGRCVRVYPGRWAVVPCNGGAGQRAVFAEGLLARRGTSSSENRSRGELSSSLREEGRTGERPAGRTATEGTGVRTVPRRLEAKDRRRMGPEDFRALQGS